MKYITARGATLSVIALGTVQLGMRYGLDPDFGQPDEEAAFAVLEQAAALGINHLDTANNYGDSEAVIGRWLAARRAAERDVPFVVTKIGPLRHGAFDMLRDDILRQAEGCRENLGQDTLDCLMLHDFADYERDPDGVRRVFAQLKRDGVCKYTALSAYSRHDYRRIADSGFDAVQIPLNVFDWGQINSGGIEALRRADMIVYARSVFLQGLVFLTPESLDPRMDFCAEPLRRYLALCEGFGLSPAALALSFVRSVPGVTAAVLGCQTPAQVRDNCALADGAVALEDAQMEQLRRAFAGIDPRVINPGAWFNAGK